MAGLSRDELLPVRKTNEIVRLLWVFRVNVTQKGESATHSALVQAVPLDPGPDGPLAYAKFACHSAAVPVMQLKQLQKQLTFRLRASLQCQFDHP